jgi:hypothetical protein
VNPIAMPREKILTLRMGTGTGGRFRFEQRGGSVSLTYDGIAGCATRGLTLPEVEKLAHGLNVVLAVHADWKKQQRRAQKAEAVSDGVLAGCYVGGRASLKTTLLHVREKGGPSLCKKIKAENFAGDYGEPETATCKTCLRRLAARKEGRS